MSPAHDLRAVPPAASEAPDIAAIGRFAAGLSRVSWFTAVGQDLTDAETREAGDYLDALGLGHATLLAARSWREAEAVTRDPGWNPAWWNAEESLRQSLLAAAARDWGESALLAALTRVTEEATEITLGAASIAASRDGVADPSLARVASGAATQAAYHAALARAARQGDSHPFAIKFRLFAAGRWPLGLTSTRFYLF